jgi:hypothetical protein
MTQHGWKDATLDETQIRAWWTKTPAANVAIACNPSNLCVLDVDHGLADEVAFNEWAISLPDSGFPPTYVVRTGRRPEFGAQMYFEGAIPDVGLWKHNGCEGQIKSLGGYVMAAGSIHPDSKLAYEVFADEPLQATPSWVRALKSSEREALNVEAGKKIPEGAGRHHAMTSVAGSLRARGLDADAIYEALIPVNQAMCEVPINDEDLQAIARSVTKLYAPQATPPEVVIGKPSDKPIVADWRELFHSKQDALHAPPISFLIDGFLQREGVTAIAGPVRERKSLIALNLAHALLTGEKLFDHFEVTQPPARVLYLCPEVSLGPFTDRLKKIGLIDHVGETLFYRTLSSPASLSLADESLLPALPGSVVILDTAIRFLEGDENSSQDVRSFADSIFALLRHGAESVVMLHHSPKDSGDYMTLENAMRGSGDMGAFLASCWGTKLQDPTDPYKSASFVSNLKQRDFESKDFELTCDEDCRMHIVGDPATRAVSLQTRKGNKANKDGKDEAAEAAITANLTMPIRKMKEHLASLGIERGTSWISQARSRLKGDAVVLAG